MSSISIFAFEKEPISVSTTDQAIGDYKLATQRKEIIEYCDIQGLDLHKVFEDRGTSNSSISGRPGLEDALVAIKEDEAKYLITSKLSRISRKISEVLTVIKKIEETDAYFISVKDGIDTATAVGKHFIDTAAIIAEPEN